MSEIFLQDLIGKRVYARDGAVIGRIEEVIAEPSGKDLLVKEYHLGTFALVERLSSGEIGRAILRFFGATRGDGLSVPWDEMDLSSRDRLRIKCSVDDLRPPSRSEPRRF
jgi:sporulation protein YlmC with PRC-barrel domain